MKTMTYRDTLTDRVVCLTVEACTYEEQRILKMMSKCLNETGAKVALSLADGQTVLINVGEDND